MRRLWAVERQVLSLRRYKARILSNRWEIPHSGWVTISRSEARTLRYNLCSEYPYSKLRIVPYVPGRKKP